MTNNNSGIFFAIKNISTFFFAIVFTFDFLGVRVVWVNLHAQVHLCVYGLDKVREFFVG